MARSSNLGYRSRSMGLVNISLAPYFPPPRLLPPTTHKHPIHTHAPPPPPLPPTTHKHPHHTQAPPPHPTPPTFPTPPHHTHSLPPPVPAPASAPPCPRPLSTPPVRAPCPRPCPRPRPFPRPCPPTLSLPPHTSTPTTPLCNSARKVCKEKQAKGSGWVVKDWPPIHHAPELLADPTVEGLIRLGVGVEGGGIYGVEV